MGDGGTINNWKMAQSDKQFDKARTHQICENNNRQVSRMKNAHQRGCKEYVGELKGSCKNKLRNIYKNKKKRKHISYPFILPSDYVLLNICLTIYNFFTATKCA